MRSTPSTAAPTGREEGISREDAVIGRAMKNKELRDTTNWSLIGYLLAVAEQRRANVDGEIVR